MARYNNFFVREQVAPEEPYTFVLCEVPVQAIPYALGALENRANETTWIDKENWRIGRNLIRQIQVGLLMGEGTEAINRLYRLLDSIYRGREYTLVSETPLVIEPAIPAVPDATVNPGGLLDMVDKLPGVIDPGWFGLGGRKASLADLVAALRVGNSQSATGLWDQFQGILDSGSDLSNMGDLIQELFFNSVNTAEEGGIMALLAAGIVGNLAASTALDVKMTQMVFQMNRLINTLDGGGFAPEDNILKALRGTTPASAERNVIDAIGGGLTPEQIDQMIAALEQNSTDNTAIIAKLEAIRLELV